MSEPQDFPATEAGKKRNFPPPCQIRAGSRLNFIFLKNGISYTLCCHSNPFHLILREYTGDDLSQESPSGAQTAPKGELSPSITGNGEGNGTPLQCSCLENPMGGAAWWAAVHGVTTSQTRLSNFTFTFHFHALEKEMATHSSVLAWRIPGMAEPGGRPSMGSHRVRHD